MVADASSTARSISRKIPSNRVSISHGYDIAIASNVLHATRYLEETLAHCRKLLAPSGHLVALENLRGLGWMDLTFGQLDGWWRFADDFRPHHALASPAVWRRALGNTGFEAVEVLGVDESDPPETMDKGVIVAKGPVRVEESPGTWVLSANEGGLAEEIAADLAARNQTVLLAGSPPIGDDKPVSIRARRAHGVGRCRSSGKLVASAPERTAP